MIEIEINGKTIEVEQGSMIIEAADKHGIPIPRFCYHKKLSIAANCRMCLVEVEKAPKPLPACATPVTAGMKIFTDSSKAREAQKAVMEFLLINHPLDCPICDQGGECELQDLSLGYGKDISRFTEGKRSVADENLGSLIATEMTRCIQCTRCVRFETEIAGHRELGMTNRGEHAEITTYVQNSIKHEMSGNIIDLCPVGALTSKPARFAARPWELNQTASIAPHDCVGSNIYVHTRTQKLMRIAPRENESLNEVWLSDRDRFSYLGVNSPDRLQMPMIKVDNNWQETDWETAFQFAADGLRKVLDQYGAKQIGALASPSSTTEEFFLLQKLMRGLGSSTVDHRLHQTDFADQKFAPLYPKLGIKIEELQTRDVILLVGSNIQREQPIASHRVRKASLKGSHVMSINVVDYPFNFDQQEKIIISPHQMVEILAGVAKALMSKPKEDLPQQIYDLLNDVEPSSAEKKIAAQLKKGEQSFIVLGAIAQNHPEASAIRALVQLIANLSGADWGCLTEGANSAGAWIAGAIPHRGAVGMSIPEIGLAANTALTASLRAYLLLGIEPELDCANPSAVNNSLLKSEFNIVLSSFNAPGYREYAHVILPIATFTETPGTYINAQGDWQNFKAIAIAPGEVRPAWKVLRVLANHLNIPGFDYVDSEEIITELRAAFDSYTPNTEMQWLCPKEIKKNISGITRITEWPIYSIDSVTRRSLALQNSGTYEPTAAYLNTKLAKHLHLKEGALVSVTQGGAQAELPIMISDRIPDDCVWIPAGRTETANLGSSFGVVEMVVDDTRGLG
jgi:NADH-quinone oxidoreductase subunit G